MNISESSAEDIEIDQLVKFATGSIAPISDSENVDILDWIDNFLYQWQQNGTPPSMFVDENNLIPALAAAWAAVIVEKHKWEWRLLTFHDLEDWKTLAIVPKDRSLMILPLSYIEDCLNNEEEVKISASMVALVENIIPSHPENSYANVMGGLRRIVPRG